MIKIAVMGYGTIGSGVVEVLETNRDSIAKRVGEEVEVKYVLDLRDFPGEPIEKKIVHDYKDITADEEVKIVVETMGGVEPAFTFVKAMLEAGKSVDDFKQGSGCRKRRGTACCGKGKKCEFHV